MASGYEMRVSDAEREAAAAELREHFASGRLTQDELNERLDRAFAATTRGDLSGLFTDLPSAGRPGAPWASEAGSSGGGRQSGPGGPGDYSWRHGAARTAGAFSALAIALIVLLPLGIIGAFGIGVGRPIGIVLILFVLGVLRRIFFGRRRGAPGPRRRRW